MSFPLKGNVRVKEALASLIATDRLPHAVILEGDFGTGKRTLAKYIAKAFVCEGNIRPCGGCRACHLADVGTHPDIEWIAPEEKKKNISVDKIRTLKELSYTSSHTADGRVFIIEKADTMNVSAQNSLLKVLEEPPAKLLFILLSESANKLLETVVSRCTVFSLFPPSEEEGLELLSERGIDTKTAGELLKAEHGNIGKALMSLEGAKKSKGAQLACDYLEMILERHSLDALLCVAELEKDRPAAGEFIMELKQLLISKIKAAKGLPRTAKELTLLYDAVNDAEPQLITNINLSLFFTSLTSKLMSIKGV